MAVKNLVFKKCYLLAGVMMANIFVVNEMKASSHNQSGHKEGNILQSQYGQSNNQSGNTQNSVGNLNNNTQINQGVNPNHGSTPAQGPIYFHIAREVIPNAPNGVNQSLHGMKINSNTTLNKQVVNHIHNSQTDGKTTPNYVQFVEEVKFPDALNSVNQSPHGMKINSNITQINQGGNTKKNSVGNLNNNIQNNQGGKPTPIYVQIVKEVKFPEAPHSVNNPSKGNKIIPKTAQGGKPNSNTLPTGDPKTQSLTQLQYGPQIYNIVDMNNPMYPNLKNPGKQADHNGNSSIFDFFILNANYINIIGGVAFSLANNYFKIYGLESGTYTWWGCYGWRSGRFANGIFQFDVNLNLGRGFSWLALNLFSKRRGNPLGWVHLAVKSFFSAPLTIYFGNFFYISIPLDAIVWLALDKLLFDKWIYSEDQVSERIEDISIIQLM